MASNLMSSLLVQAEAFVLFQANVYWLDILRLSADLLCSGLVYAPSPARFGLK